ADFIEGSLAPTGCNSGGTVTFADDGSKFVFNPKFDLKSGDVCKGTFTMLIPEGTALGTSVVNKMTASCELDGEGAEVTSTTPVNTRLIGLTKAATGCTKGGSACDPQNPPAGAELAYTITASTGPFIATGVIVTDSLPSTLNAATPAVSVASFVSSTCPSPSLVGSVLTCNLEDIGPNSSKSFVVIILLDPTNPSGTQIINSATATDDAMDALNVSVSVTDEVEVAGPPPAAPAPQLEVTVAGPDSAKRGRGAKFVVTVQNTGDATAHNVVLSDTLPGTLRLGRVPRIRGLRRACSGSRRAGTFTCNLGDLASGQSISFKLRTRVKRRGGANVGDVISNTVNAGSDEGSASGSAQLTVTGRSRR
ncbi:MAG: hypothetical protein ACE5I7_20380, partial [Candidatus Binatia bacterium]